MEELWENYFDWYAQRIFEGVSPSHLLQLIIAVIVLYVVLMLLSAVFPFIGRLLNIVFLPFTVLHVWMHVRAMQQIKTTICPYDLFPSLPVILDDSLYLC